MPLDLDVRPIRLPLPGLSALADEARQEEFLFLDRLIVDWEAGTNRFDETGEMFFGVFDHDQLVGVGGLNRDPFVMSEKVGRVRRFYVLPSYRRCGAGRALADKIIESATGVFEKL